MASLAAVCRKAWKFGTVPRSTASARPASSTACSAGNVGFPSPVRAAAIARRSSRRGPLAHQADPAHIDVEAAVRTSLRGAWLGGDYVARPRARARDAARRENSWRARGPLRVATRFALRVRTASRRAASARSFPRARFSPSRSVIPRLERSHVRLAERGAPDDPRELLATTLTGPRSRQGRVRRRTGGGGLSAAKVMSLRS